jgi:hypothetical protein
MTYAELFTAVASLVSGSFSIDVATWRHCRDGMPDRVLTTWSIYVAGGANLSCSCDTPEAALEELKAKLEPVRSEAAEGLPTDEQAVGVVP